MSKEPLTFNISKKVGYLSTTQIGELCGCSRVWAFEKARRGFFDEFKLPGWSGKHYRFSDSAKLRARCAAIKADRERERLPRPKSGAWAGVSTWTGLRFQFELLMRQIGGSWADWDASDRTEVRDYLRPMVEFDRQLRGERNDLA